MRAANKNIILPVSALFLVLAFVPMRAHAQTFGGGRSSSLYSSSNASVFQAPGGIKQGGETAQGSSAALLQSSEVKVLIVAGAPKILSQNEPSDQLNNNSEVIWLSVFAGAFALGVLYLLSRQIKRSY